jgi:hypothetical protein
LWGKLDTYVDFNPKNKSWQECFFELEQKNLTNAGRRGIYNKPGFNQFSRDETYRFDYSIDEHAELFKNYFEELTVISRKSIVMIYLLSFFRVWNKTKYTEKKYITALIANMWCDQLSIIRFFSDFPDAKIIFVLRRPDTWLKSALIHRAFKEDDESASICLLEYWKDSVRNLYEFSEIYGNNIVPIVYEDLTNQPEHILRKLCNIIQIDFHPCLLTPTFSGEKIYPNSSFNIDKKLIVSDDSREPPKFTERINLHLSKFYMPEYNLTRKIILDRYYS